jgi:selenocysteine lyase/cysteine desulfurase
MTLQLVGDGQLVPIITGGEVPYLNLDSAASTPPLTAVKSAVDAFLPWYSSVHRGAGYKSIVSTREYESARQAVGAFVNARSDDAVVFTRNTTDSLNMLAHAVGANRRILLFESEHHANLLPWRRQGATVLPLPAGPKALLTDLAAVLDENRRSSDCLVAVTGASNVTGELWPIAEIVDVAHARGARVVVDAAQLAPHVPIDMHAWGVDYLAISGHKLYAPYGAGALIGRADWLADGEPFLAGGGAVEFVTPDEVLWSDLPDRQEAGSPNVVGAVALAAACRVLKTAGMAALSRHEAALLRRAETLLDGIPGLNIYTTWGRDHPRIGVLTFNLSHLDHALLAAILSAEYGIGVRHGCFCAHPLMLRLLDVETDVADHIRAELKRGRHVPLPGAVRCSFGVATTMADVERFAAAVRRIAADGPQWRYVKSPDADWFDPVPDPRPAPIVAAI